MYVMKNKSILKILIFGIIITTIIEFIIIPVIHGLLDFFFTINFQRPLGYYLFFNYSPIIIAGLYFGFQNISLQSKKYAFFVGFIYVALRNFVLKSKAVIISEILVGYFPLVILKAGIVCLLSAYVMHYVKIWKLKHN